MPDYVTTTVRPHGELPAGVEILVYGETDDGNTVTVKWLDAGRSFTVPVYCLSWRRIFEGAR